MVSAWSIGRGKRGDLKSSSIKVPGPGAYSLHKEAIIIPPKWGFGTSNRSNMGSSFAPGPGQYNSPSTLKGSKYSIGSSKKPKVESFLDVPGPGAYSPTKTIFYAPPQYSMLGKSFHSYNKLAPGPGTYEHKSSVLNIPSSKFSKTVRNELSQSMTITPGVGNYELSRPSSAAPKFGFGTSQRPPSGEGLPGGKQTPGPGQYYPKGGIDTSKGVTMISRRGNGLANELAKLPGPGAYSPGQKDKKHNPAFKIGTEQREFLDRESLSTPGPGTYDPRMGLNRPTSPAIRVGTDQRKPLNNTIDVPGPGRYNIRPGSSDGPKLSFKGVNNLDPTERERSKVPGPGQYMPSVYYVKKRPSSAKIGTSMRSSFNGNKDAPGPGNYNLGKGEHGPKWGFGSGQRDNNKTQNQPGPGTYNIPAFFADVPKFMMTNHPGPGEYYTKKGDQGPKWGFGTGQRGDNMYSQDPGPGSYNIPEFFPDAPKYMKTNHLKNHQS